MHKLRLALLGLLGPAILLAGCSSLWDLSSASSRRGVSSSLVDFLYPEGQEPPPYSEAIPQLNVPLRVGLAFVPSRNEQDKPILSEATKSELLYRVRDQFRDRSYISDIEIIPDAYMRGGRGFTSLDQLARLHNLDVMALVSYDQVAASEDTTASFLYWQRQLALDACWRYRRFAGNQNDRFLECHGEHEQEPRRRTGAT